MNEKHSCFRNVLAPTLSICTTEQVLPVTCTGIRKTQLRLKHLEALMRVHRLAEEVAHNDGLSHSKSKHVSKAASAMIVSADACSFRFAPTSLCQHKQCCACCASNWFKILVLTKPSCCKKSVHRQGRWWCRQYHGMVALLLWTLLLLLTSQVKHGVYASPWLV